MTRKEQLRRQINQESLYAKRQINRCGMMIGKIRLEIHKIDKFLSEADMEEAVDPMLDLRRDFEGQIEELRATREQYRENLRRLDDLRVKFEKVHQIL